MSSSFEEGVVVLAVAMGQILRECPCTMRLTPSQAQESAFACESTALGLAS